MSRPRARHDKNRRHGHLGDVSQNGTNWHRQERAIAALVAGATLDDAAKSAGVSHRTIACWRCEPAFRNRLLQLGDESLAEARLLLQAILPRAVGTLASLLASPDDGLKLRAAATLLRGLITTPPSDTPAKTASPIGRVMLIPAEHIEIVSAAWERNAQPGDPPVVILPEDEPLTEGPADAGTE